MAPDALAMRAADWRRTGNVLVIRLDNLGDVLMTTPAIHAVARSGLGRRVTLLASRSGAAVAGHVASLAEVIVYEAPWVKGQGRGQSTGMDERIGPVAGAAAADRAFIERLAALRFDAAVVFTVSTQSALPAALMCRLAGIPRCLAASRENPYALVTDWIPDTEVCADGMRHEVVRQLDLVASVGFDAPVDDRLVFESHADEARSVRHKRAAAGADPGQPYVVVHVGSSAPSRRYPPDRFGHAARLVAEQSGLAVVFAGSEGERPWVDAAQAAMRSGGGSRVGTPLAATSLAGRLTVGELAALISGARLLICNNSGPAHLAAAAGTPVVVLYALTNPQHTPWRVASRVLSHPVPCRNCLKSVCPVGHHDCLLKIEPTQVAEAALELLGETAAPAREASMATAT